MATPVKAIHNLADFENFKKSTANADILDFVRRCAEASVGTQNHSDVGDVVFPAVVTFVELMERLNVLVDEVPPIKQPMRFGNKAFRTWHTEMVKIVAQYIGQLEEKLNVSDLAVEVTPYFAEMFGNSTRIDYGTGHELNFAVVFLALTKLGALEDSKEALASVMTTAFPSYIRTMRRLQTEYMLEPAGSHGVWGLDDYHCLLFLWGAAQLSGQKEVRPSDIHNPELLKEYAPEYTYFEGIQFIKRIKSSAPFAETSPMLNDISGLHDWAKICSGLMRMFEGEVLHKFPVIQHLLFGRALKCTWASSGPSSSGAQGTGLPAGYGTAFPQPPGTVFVRSRGGSPSRGSSPSLSNASSGHPTPTPAPQSRAAQTLAADSTDSQEGAHAQPTVTAVAGATGGGEHTETRSEGIAAGEVGTKAEAERAGR